MIRSFEVTMLFLCLFGCQTKPTVRDATGKASAPSADPKLTKPTVKRIWIPRKIEDDGRVMEDGHWRYEITGGSTWSN